MKFTSPNFFIILFILILFSSCKKDDTVNTPNVIFVLTDDLGFADLSSYGSKMISTPNLDSMASEGALLTSYYSTQAVCSASRASILTGSYPNRIGFSGALGPNSKKGINPNEFLMSEMFKQEGYNTAIYGNGILEITKSFYQQIMGLMIFLEYYILMICGLFMQNIPTAILI